MREDLARLLLRVMLAVVFGFHAAQKLFGAFGGGGIAGFTAYLAGIGTPFPEAAAWVAAAAESAAVVGLLTGWKLSMTLPGAAFCMFYAAFFAHGSAFNAQKNGMEYTLTLAVSLVSLILLGPGRYSATNSYVDKQRSYGLLKN